MFGDKLAEVKPSVRLLALPKELRTTENANKLSAYTVAVETNRFENDYRVFEKVVLALNGLTVDPEELHPPTIPEICWALYEISLKKRAFSFSEEICLYVAQVAKQEGYVWLPEEMSVFREYLEIPQELKPLQEKVKKLWPRVARTEPEFKENPVDIQLAKLLVCKHYVQERKYELEKEIESLKEERVLV